METGVLTDKKRTIIPDDTSSSQSTQPVRLKKNTSLCSRLRKQRGKLRKLRETSVKIDPTSILRWAESRSKVDPEEVLMLSDDLWYIASQDCSTKVALASPVSMKDESDSGLEEKAVERFEFHQQNAESGSGLVKKMIVMERDDDDTITDSNSDFDAFPSSTAEESSSFLASEIDAESQPTNVLYKPQERLVPAETPLKVSESEATGCKKKSSTKGPFLTCLRPNPLLVKMDLHKQQHLSSAKVDKQ